MSGEKLPASGPGETPPEDGGGLADEAPPAAAPPAGEVEPSGDPEVRAATTSPSEAEGRSRGEGRRAKGERRRAKGKKRPEGQAGAEASVKEGEAGTEAGEPGAEGSDEAGAEAAGEPSARGGGQAAGDAAATKPAPRVPPRWGQIETVATAGGLGSIAVLVWALYTQLNQWPAAPFVLLLYGGLLGALVASYAARRGGPYEYGLVSAELTPFMLVYALKWLGAYLFAALLALVCFIALAASYAAMPALLVLALGGGLLAAASYLTKYAVERGKLHDQAWPRLVLWSTVSVLFAVVWFRPSRLAIGWLWRYISNYFLAL